MNKENIIYFAGIFDGEGSMMIELQSKNAVRKYDYFSLRVVVTNTNLELIQWLKTNFGGNIGTRPQIQGRKITYDWKIYSKDAANIIKSALPYLIIKKQRALVFIEFAETIGKTGWNITEEIRLQRQSLYNSMKIHNKQGT